ncbi:MAG: M48 family metallopeptidase [Candidatus Magasanikbacteria bacterium]|nr:M48 family metallopeptidase [Candidatus Magasanikbacteria bacterium]
MEKQTQQFSYTLKKHVRSRRITISVNCDARVLVTIPKRVSMGVVEKFVYEQTEWILKQIEKMKGKKKFVFPEGVTQTGLHASKSRAKKILKQRLAYFNQFYHFDYNKIVIRNQKSRWGSCSANRNLNFNYKLLFVADHLRDYVVVHELCHLKEMNHSKKFWDLVAKTIPDHQKRRKKLRGLGV